MKFTTKLLPCVIFAAFFALSTTTFAGGELPEAGYMCLNIYYDMQVFDQEGVLVLETDVSDNNALDQLPAGSYTVVLFETDGSIFDSFIYEK